MVGIDKIVKFVFLLGVIIFPRLSKGQCVTPTDTLVTSILSCEPYTWDINGITYSSSVTKKIVSDDCVLNILNLTIYGDQVESKRVFSCGDYFWGKSGETYSASGTYTHLETTGEGCTIEHRLVLTVSDAYSSSPGAAACYVYEWHELGLPVGDMQALAVDLDGSGTLLAIGNEWHGVAGEVKVYQWSESGWAQMGETLTAESEAEHFGASVSLSASGQYLGVGSPYRNHTEEPGQYGQVKVFEWTGTGWSQRGSTIQGIHKYDNFGFDVDFSNDGNILAASAPSSGRVSVELGETRVYQWTGEDWAQMGDHIYNYWAKSSPNNNGHSIALSGNGKNLVAGAPFTYGVIRPTPGANYRYNWDGTQWNERGVPGNHNNERLGWSVAISDNGNYTAVSAPGFDNSTGRVYAGPTILYGEDAGAQYGKGVALDFAGDVIAIGSSAFTASSSTEGKVEVLQRVNDSWVQIGQDLFGTAYGEHFGNQVALNHSGNILAVASAKAGLDPGDPVTDMHVYYYGCAVPAQNCTESPCTETIETSVEISQCLPYYFGNSYKRNSGIYQHTFQSQAGCDSLVTLNLTILRSDRLELEISACTSYEFDGELFTESDYFAARYKNTVGCDSIVMVRITIGAGFDTYFQNVTTCGSYEFNGNTLTESGSYEARYTRSSGCDSLVKLELTILDSYSGIENVEACVSYNFDGKTLTSSGAYEGIFTTTAGCDSLVTLNLFIVDSFSVNKSVTACNSYEFDGNVLTASGTYNGAFTSYAGCDSLVTLDLEIVEKFNTNESVTTCGPYDFFGETLTISGSYTETLMSSTGCDSLVTVNLTVLDPSEEACDSLTTGIGDEPTTSVSVYPNPVEDQYSIDLGREYDNVVIEIRTISGQLITSKAYPIISRIESSIEAPAGIYIISVSGDNLAPFTKKIIKKQK